MAKSDAEICNTALQRVGITLGIESLTQRVKEAIVCALVYEMVRGKVLTEAQWPFARRYQLLNLSGAPPLKWRYRYVYPNDCLQVRGIFPGDMAGNGGEVDPALLRSYIQQYPTPYEIVTDENGDMTICTDLPTAAIEFTANVTNPARYSARFASAFAWALAAEITLPLARDVNYMKNALYMYDRELGQAIAAAFNESTREKDPESIFVRERF